MIAEKITDGRFQAAEAEIVVGFIAERPGKIERGGIPGGGEAIDFRAGRIGQAQHLAGFIKAFSGGVVGG